uniref:Squamosa promoter-binding-like protein 14 n=1 Tax=Anthurium amnicola TaxID=1678845 RepID=A0A1D1Y6Q4_9ARAE
MEMGSVSLGASGNNDALQGLKFGKRIYFGELGGGAPGAPVPSSATPMSALAPSSSGSTAFSVPASSAVGPKRGQPQPPRCQVEGCKADLTGAKAYYCRHKVCGMHSKSPKVIVAGMEQRFCQQCSRFHLLPEFDQGKRSCRRRLAGHNERRRKPPPGSLRSRYGRVPSTFHEDGKRFGGLLLDFSYPRISSSERDLWLTVRVGDQGVSSHWQAGLDTESSGIVANTTHSHIRSSAGGTSFSCQEIPPGEGFGLSDSSCALSLLSTQPWGTTPTKDRTPTISENNYGGAPLPQAGAAASFMSSSWGFRGQSSTAHEISHEMVLRQPTEIGDFLGESEVALQGNKQCMGPGNERVFTPGNLMNWSL